MSRSAHPGLVWIQEHTAELQKKYPGEWIAVDGKGNFFHNKDLDALGMEIKKANHHLWDFRIEKVDSP